MRLIARIVVAAVLLCVLLWVVATAALYATMRQTPERFGAVMSHVPGVAMIALPFKPLWFVARKGALEIGERAPDFSLPALHGGDVVRLSDQYRQKPVVLVFGSYT